MVKSMKKEHIKLTKPDREYLESIISKGKVAAKVFKRAMGLLELNRGKTLQEVAKTLAVDYNTVASWRDNYKKSGLACLKDAPRSGRPIEIDGNQRAKITALACSALPVGHGKWSLRLLADKIVELGEVETISHTQVSKILKKTN
jgi:transposase